MADALLRLPAPLVLLVVGLVMVAESGLLVGLVLPGATAALTLGFFAHIGVVPLAAAVPIACCAAVSGGQLGYLRGRGWSHRRWYRRGGWRHQVVAALCRDRNQIGAIVLGQWVGGARTLVPRIVAGGGMCYARFVLVQVPGAIVWGATLVVTGDLLGAAYERAGVALTLSAVVCAVALVVVLLARLRHSSGT